MRLALLSLTHSVFGPRRRTGTMAVEWSEPIRSPTRRVHANGHAGGTRTSILGTSIIKLPLKGNTSHKR
jgi:hypothetical protein